MKKLLLLFFILICSFARAEDIYIAQSAAGSENGTSCANAYAVTWFNTSGNWQNPKTSGKIGPGDTTHLCGTISSPLTVYASGDEGNVITIYWEDDAKLSAAANSGYWITVGSHNYITFDGGTNGIIENTDNGTGSEYGGTYNNQVTTGGITSSGDEITVQDLTIQNLYVRKGYTMDPAVGSTGMFFNYCNGITIQDVTIQHAKSGIVFQTRDGEGDIWIDGTTVYGSNHNIEIAHVSGTLSHVTISNCILDGMDFWEQETPSPDLGFHRDLIFPHTDYTLQYFYIYNNRLGPGYDPQTSVAGTAAIYFDGNLGSTPTYSDAYVFNNQFLLKSPLSWSGCQGAACVGSSEGDIGLVANNIFVAGSGVTNNISFGIEHGIVANNITYYPSGGTFGIYFKINSDSLSGDSITVNKNIYYGVKSWDFSYSIYQRGVGYKCAQSTFSGYQACTAASGQDADSTTDDPEFINPSPVVGTGNYHLQATSPAIGTGINLTSYASQITTNDSSDMAAAAAAALVKDIDGVSRDPSDPWDMGIYVYDSSDTEDPTCTITSPTSDPAYDAGTTSSVALSGSASDNVGIIVVLWSNSLGGSGTATGTTSWSQTVPLVSGSNVITITAWDASGNYGTDVITVSKDYSSTRGRARLRK